MSDPRLIRWRSVDDIVYIDLCRAEKRNALNHSMRIELMNILERLKSSAKVVVLGANTSVFCAGIDLKERIENVDPAQEMWKLIQAIYEFPGIVIAKVSGLALGGGVSLIDACDLAIASSDARFGLPEIGFGVYPAIAGPLTQLTIAKKHAAWMVLSGEQLSAEQALAMALVNETVDNDKLEEHCEALAKKIASYDQDGLMIAKAQLNNIPVNAEQRQKAVQQGIASNLAQIDKLQQKD